MGIAKRSGRFRSTCSRYVDSKPNSEMTRDRRQHAQFAPWRELLLGSAGSYREEHVVVDRHHEGS